MANLYQVIEIGPYTINGNKIDEIIAPIIELLNKKGYKTRACCSGHYWDNKIPDMLDANCYIMFENNIDFDLPFDFKIDGLCTIRKYFSCIDSLELQREILSTALNLITLVKNLPNKGE